MNDFTIIFGNFAATESTIIAHTDEARRFLAIGDAGVSITVRKSAVQHYTECFADEGLAYSVQVVADEDTRALA